MSLTDGNLCRHFHPPTYLSFTSVTISIILSITAAGGNLLVLLAIVFDPNKNLRSPFSFLVANLAAADLIVGCFVDPLSIEFHIHEGFTVGSGKITRPEDNALRSLLFISSTASLLSIGALTVDRFIAITKPLTYRATLSPRRTAVVSITIWVFSAGLSSLYFEVGYLRYLFVFANTAVASTFIILTFTYIKVFKNFRVPIQDRGMLQDGTAEDRMFKQTIEREKRITKTFMITLCLFMTCFVPSLILIYIIGFCSHCRCIFIEVARDVVFLLILANSSMNPYVFAWRLRAYREAFIKILKCHPFARKVGLVPHPTQNSSTREGDNSVQILAQ